MQRASQGMLMQCAKPSTRRYPNDCFSTEFARTRGHSNCARNSKERLFQQRQVHGTPRWKSLDSMGRFRETYFQVLMFLFTIIVVLNYRFVRWITEYFPEIVSLQNVSVLFGSCPPYKLPCNPEIISEIYRQNNYATPKRLFSFPLMERKDK